MGSDLVVQGLRAGYGDLTAVWDLDFTVQSGKILVILGRNGAGKTTTLHALAGLLPGSSGSVQIGGVEIGRLPAYKRVTNGVGLVQEGKQIFRRLTVEENLLMGGYTLGLSRRHLREAIAEAYDRFSVLGDRRTDSAGALSGGQQQMLALAQALLAKPKVLMLDEPSAGLAPSIVDRVFLSIEQLKSEDIAIVLVEQLAEHALRLADEVLVMDIGRIIMRQSAGDEKALELLQGAYFGKR
jgi:branched-chain amino acid transport system ATP-binding protein